MWLSSGPVNFRPPRRGELTTFNPSFQRRAVRLPPDPGAMESVQSGLAHSWWLSPPRSADVPRLAHVHRVVRHQPGCLGGKGGLLDDQGELERSLDSPRRTPCWPGVATSSTSWCRF